MKISRYSYKDYGDKVLADFSHVDFISAAAEFKVDDIFEHVSRVRVI